MNLPLPFLARYLAIGCVAFTVLSCTSKKTLTEGSLDENLSAKAVIREHYQNALDFKTMSGKMRIEYSDGEDAQGVSVSLRMEKDKALWISAPFGVVKAYITPGRVTFYNKLQNEYFDGDFAYLSKFLGMELDFEQVQNLLLGQAMLNLKETKYEVSVTGDTYQLQPKSALELFKVLFQIEPENFRMASQQLSQPLRKRLLQVNYGDYQKTGKYLLPQTIGIVAIENDQRSTVDIDYRNIEFDRPLSFPYKIPTGFEEIKLKEDAL